MYDLRNNKYLNRNILAIIKLYHKKCVYKYDNLK